MKNYGNSENLEKTVLKETTPTGIVQTTSESKTPITNASIESTKNSRTKKKKNLTKKRDRFSLSLNQKRILGRLEAEALLVGLSFFPSQAWEKYCNE